MKILLASDGSPNAERAARWVVSLAGSMKTPPQVLVACVHDDAPYRIAMRHVGRAEVVEVLTEQCQKDVAEVQAVLTAAGLKPDVRLEIGTIANTLVDLAKREGATMIVMGQKGRTMMSNLLMGSIAARVLALSELPVTLVR